MDIQKIREDFPILSRTVYGKPLVYFDNGATTQKPRLVVDALVDEYYSVNAITFPSRQRNCMKPPARRYGSLSMPAARMRSSLHGVRLKVSICLFPVLEMSLCRKAMK